MCIACWSFNSLAAMLVLRVMAEQHNIVLVVDRGHSQTRAQALLVASRHVVMYGATVQVIELINALTH
jgi:hypothetical protein